MKKKTLLITLLFLCIFSLVGCTKKREAEEEIILADPHELEVDKNNTKIENTAEDDVGDA